MTNKIRTIFVLCFSALSSISASTFMAQESQAAQRLGGLNITQDTCRAQTYVFYVKPVVLNSKDAYSWRCRVYPLPVLSGPYLYETGIDMTKVCESQYGRGAYSSPMNTKDAYSWQCYR
ncbi:hypothetical protein V2H45_04055 [Tumidithrix elongata RA019]|uniref:Uncharacterized protein n=1 Tax=Tumidithrix elongata BACA0141 TaxID=2716417 RepID=A0AAW9PR14_9CYAN|nr:hypothetical protein [Tumidithrix elongata RA019]